MSHRPAWLCSDCKHQLGEVVCGKLRMWPVGVVMVGEDGLAVNCPRCGAVNVWRYRLETAAS